MNFNHRRQGKNKDNTRVNFKLNQMIKKSWNCRRNHQLRNKLILKEVVCLVKYHPFLKNRAHNPMRIKLIKKNIFNNYERI